MNEPIKLLKTITQHDIPIYCVRWTRSNPEQFLASCGEIIRLWDVNNDNAVKRFVGHSGFVIHMILSENNDNQFLSCSIDKTIKLWDIESEECIRTFSGHHNHISYLVWIPNNVNQFLSCSYDRTIKLWNIGSEECIRTFNGSRNGVWYMLLAPTDNTQFLSYRRNNEILFWNINSKRYIRKIPDHAKGITQPVWMSDDNNIFLSCSIGTIRLWNINSDTCIRTFTGLSGPVNICRVHHNITYREGKNNQFISYDNKTIKLWDINIEDPIKTFPHCYGSPCNVSWVKNSNRYFMSIGYNEVIRFWDIDSGKCIGASAYPDSPSYHNTPHERRINFVSWVPCYEHRFVSCSADGIIKLWEHTIDVSLVIYIKQWLAGSNMT